MNKTFFFQGNLVRVSTLGLCREEHMFRVTPIHSTLLNFLSALFKLYFICEYTHSVILSISFCQQICYAVTCHHLSTKKTFPIFIWLVENLKSFILNKKIVIKLSCFGWWHNFLEIKLKKRSVEKKQPSYEILKPWTFLIGEPFVFFGLRKAMWSMNHTHNTTFYLISAIKVVLNGK